jgi:hypothetical protein
MPEVQEVFRMATQKIRPDPGAMERQFREQRRRSTRRKAGVFGLVAALLVGATIVAANVIPADRSKTPVGQPSGSTTPPAAVTDGTVTFDGSTCSMEITADRIEPGTVVFDVVNATDQRVMFDSWEILEGYTFRAFATAIEQMRRLLEAGKPYPSHGGPFPDQETDVRYLRSDVIPANSSGSIAATMSSGTYGITCLQRFEGAHPSFQGFRQPFGIAGPIVVP